MNEEVLDKYYRYLRGKHGNKGTIATSFQGIRRFNKYVNKPFSDVTIEDFIEFKETLKTQNTQRSYICSINRFFKWYGKPEIKLPIPEIKRPAKKVFSESEKNLFLEAAKTKPLYNVVALLLYDGLLRPCEVINIKICDIDFENHCIYLSKTKVNDNVPALMSPRLEHAIKEYLKTRPEPHPEDKDYLIIYDKGRRKHRRPVTNYFVRRIVSKIAVEAGIKRRVTPYKTIKPSALTLRFNDKVNPKTLQRLARHKRITSTLIYDHSTDKDALNYLKTQTYDYNYKQLSRKEKLRETLQEIVDKRLRGEIDQPTFNTLIELLKPDISKHEETIGYA